MAIQPERWDGDQGATTHLRLVGERLGAKIEKLREDSQPEESDDQGHSQTETANPSIFPSTTCDSVLEWFFMALYKNNAFSRRLPDIITEELVFVLSQKTPYEFKQLFEVLHDKLRRRNAANGGAEMLRLRAYEKLQNLVSRGAVKKNGKIYTGNSAALAVMAANSVPAPVATSVAAPAAASVSASATASDS
jgi:hypothetical protein